MPQRLIMPYEILLRMPLSSKSMPQNTSSTMRMYGVTDVAVSALFISVETTMPSASDA